MDIKKITSYDINYFWYKKKIIFKNVVIWIFLLLLAVTYKETLPFAGLRLTSAAIYYIYREEKTMKVNTFFVYLCTS